MDKIHFGEALLKITLGVHNPWEDKPTPGLKISCNKRKELWFNFVILSPSLLNNEIHGIFSPSFHEF